MRHNKLVGLCIVVYRAGLHACSKKSEHCVVIVLHQLDGTGAFRRVCRNAADVSVVVLEVYVVVEVVIVGSEIAEIIHIIARKDSDIVVNGVFTLIYRCGDAGVTVEVVAVFVRSLLAPAVAVVIRVVVVQVDISHTVGCVVLVFGSVVKPYLKSGIRVGCNVMMEFNIIKPDVLAV